MRRVLVLLVALGISLSFLAGCSGGTSPAGSPQTPTTNPTPAITSVSPASIAAGAGAQTLTITGTGFVSGSVVSFNSTVLQTTYTSATSLQAALPATSISGGQAASITVANPVPGGGSSVASSFAVMAPTPVIGSVSPSAMLQAPAATLTITGTGFESNSSVLWNGSSRTTTFVNATTLQVAIGADDGQTLGSAQVTVNNPGPGGSTSPAASVVIYGRPTISSLSPTSAAVGAASFQLTVTGANFLSGAVVTLDSSSLATTYVSATTLQVTVPSSMLSTGRTASITVQNPSPAAAQSLSTDFAVTNPLPTLASISPAYVPIGQSAAIALTGTGFNVNSIALWNGSARPTTYVSALSLKVTLTAADLQTAGSGQITVSNAAPGGGTTAAQTLTMIAPPTISSISPSTIPVSTSYTSTTAFTVNGSNFATGSYVTVNGYKLTNITQTATQITATIPGSAISYAGAFKVYVYSPVNTTQVLTQVFQSSAVNLNVINPSATFTVSPSGAPSGSPDTKISITGNGFFADSVVQWNGAALATTFGTSSGLTAVVPAALLTQLGNSVISINTPENLGQAGTTQTFNTYLSLPVNDIVWNSVDSLIYATVGSAGGSTIGNSLIAIDPNTGTVMKTIFVGSEPNRLALSTDGTQAFVGLNGAGAVRQVNLTTGTAGGQFGLGGGPGIYNAPYTASSLAAVPGQPNSVAVYATNGVVTIYDSGVARAKSSSGLQSYFNSNTGGLAFGASASTLYLSSSSAGNYVYVLTVDSTGLTAYKQLNSSGYGSPIQYDNGRLYFPSGVVTDATTGNTLGQFSVPSSYSTTPSPASGPIVSDSTLNRAWGVPTNGSGIVSFDEKTFNSVTTVPIGSSVTSGAADLIRWGQTGLAFHAGSQLYILQGALVKDNSSTPVDLQVTAQVPTAVTTGTSFAATFQILNNGSNTAQGTTFTAALPASVLYGSVTTSQGSCSGAGIVYCDLGTLASGATATVTLNGTPSTAGAIQITGASSSQSFDSNSSNNQVTASTTSTGSLYSGVPSISSLSPNLVASGASTFTLTVAGSGFTTASTVNWNGSALPTTLVSSTSLTATVDASLVKLLGWGTVTVSSAAPGGGTSGPLTFSIYSLLSVPANAMVYDPFTRKLWAALPSTSTPLSGNSIVSVDPLTGTTGTPIQVGSEPNVLGETSSGNYIYVGLSGAKSLGRFNMSTQKLDFTVPLTSTSIYPAGPVAANAVAIIPGVDTSVGIPNVGILDFNGSTATTRPNSILSYTDAVFTDSGHAYSFDNYSSGAEFYRYTVDANGVHLVDGTTLLGMGGFSGGFALDGGLGYGASGGIFNPSTTPPSQVATMQLGSGPYGTGLVGGGVIPYAATQKEFAVAINDAGSWLVFIERFDTKRFVYEDSIQLPTTATLQSAPGTRWGQDGLAYLLTAGLGGSGPSQMMLIRGPFVLPAEAGTNSAPVLSAVGSGTVAAGSGNQRITVTGSSFLPGASVVWGGVVHDTTFVNSQTLTVAVGAAELTAGTVSVTCRNPGSADSNAVSVTIQ